MANKLFGLENQSQIPVKRRRVGNNPNNLLV